MKSENTLRTLLLFLGTFILIFLAARIGQYFFYEWETTPAILWPPTGIAFGIVWFGGYRYGIPIFMALFTAIVTGPGSHLLPGVVTTPLAQVFGVFLAKYALTRSGFSESFASVREVLAFLSVIVVASMIPPSISTLTSYLSGTLTVPPYLSWSRSWAGHIFSFLIISPLILSWVRSEVAPVKTKLMESMFMGVILIVSVYLLFWEHTLSNYSFLFFSIFFIAHIWVSFRFPLSVVTLSLFVSTVVGMAGLFLSPDPEESLNEQLFGTELFLFFVVPIFYAFSALVKERARTVAELKAAMDRIEQEGVLKNNFISVLAHELRNPLAPVKTTLEVLREMDLGTETQKLVSDAHLQVHSMRRLLDDLLDATRVSQGKFALHVERSHLCSMIERSVATTKSLNHKGHEYIFTPCDETLWIDVDPVRFEQVLVNVLNNAAKYTNPGGRIDLSYEVQDDRITIRVTDNGIGIPSENLTNIFEPFWQAKAGRVPESGIGVGLSLTKHIVELHRGTIRAESKGHGHGSTFIITLPLSQNEKSKSYVKNASFGPVPKCRILIVDDNHAAADSLQKLLSLKGHTTSVAYSGKSALETEIEFGADIILLDIGLTDMTGYEAARKLRARGYHNKIIALSGYSQKEDKEAAIDSGCDFHITKPMAVERLEEFIVSNN